MRFFKKTNVPVRDGIRGRATVEHVEMLHGGMEVNVSRRKTEAVLKGEISPLRERARLRVELPGSEPYVVTTVVAVPIMKAGRLTAGSTLEVLVDPDERERVSIDWDGECRRGSAQQAFDDSPAARSALEGLGLDPARVAREADEARRHQAPVPIWPSGIARFDGEVLEVTTGDGIRVAARDIVAISVEPPRAGRLSLKLKYRAGLSRAGTSYWVEDEHETTLCRLVEAVTAVQAG